MSDGGKLTIKTRKVGGTEMRMRFPDALAEMYICMSVSDTGAGMDDTVKQHAFEPFFTTKEKEKGTGLGLAVVYGIMKSHQGYVGFESTVGRGSTFSLHFPVWEVPAGVLEPGELSSRDDLKGKETTLIVEDEEMLRDVLRTILESNGDAVLSAVDGQEAFDFYVKRKKDIALVVADIGLPKISGGDLFIRIQKDNRGARVILASGYLEPRKKSKLFREGAKCFIQKPYDSNEILRRIREALDTP